MRCYCCDEPLSDYESTLRHAVTNEFLDMKVKCLDLAGIPYRGRPDLSKKEEESVPPEPPLWEEDE